MIVSFLTNRLRSWAWRWVKHKIRRRFPTVPPISTSALATWLAQESPPILLDVRQPKEFAVSHLPHARHAPTAESALQAGLASDSPVVAYCSVGYRSARLAQQLQAAGFTQVYNLEGSIFQWANEGRRMVQCDRTVDRVHPYNRLWGLLLDADSGATTEPGAALPQSHRHRNHIGSVGMGQEVNQPQQQPNAQNHKNGDHQPP